MNAPNVPKMTATPPWMEAMEKQLSDVEQKIAEMLWDAAIAQHTEYIVVNADGTAALTDPENRFPPLVSLNMAQP